jgi:hypothetical protein
MDDLPATLQPGYFDRLYGQDPDPWRFATSDYERAKYAATVAALPRERFASPGSSPAAARRSSPWTWRTRHSSKRASGAPTCPASLSRA